MTVRLAALLGLALFAPLALAQTGALDPTFGGAGVARVDWPSGSADAAGAARLPGGAYAVLSNYNFGVARVTPEGRLDDSFGTDGWASDTPRESRSAQSIAVQPDGKILVGGYSTTYHAPSGTTRYYLTVVRYTATGALDTAFGTGGRAYTNFPDYTYMEVESVAVAPDGRIAAGGWRYDAGQYQWMLAVFTSAGALDTSFSGDGRVSFDAGASNGCTYYNSSEIRALAFRPDGRLVAAGSACTSLTGGTVGTDLVVTQFTTAGAIPGGFGTGGFAAVDFYYQQSTVGLAIQPDGRVVVAGQTYYDGNHDPVDYIDIGVARFTTSGGLDASFGTNGVATLSLPDESSYETAAGVAVDASGRIVVAGTHNDYSTNQNRWLVGRLTASGVPDATFDGNGIAVTDWGAQAEVRGLVVEPDGRPLLVGYAYDIQGLYGGTLARYVESPVADGVTVRFRLNANGLPNRLPTDTFGVRGSIAPLSWDATVPLADADGDGVWEGMVTFPASAAGDSLEWRFVAHRAGSTTAAVEVAPAASGAARGFLLADDRTASGSYLGALHDAHANALPVDLSTVPYYGFQDYATAGQGYISPTPEANEVPVACSDETTGSVWYRVAASAAPVLISAEVQSYDGLAIAVEVFLPGERSVPPPACDAWEPAGGRPGGLASALGRPLAPAREMRPLVPAVEAMRALGTRHATPPSPADVRRRDAVPAVAWGPQPAPVPTREEVARAAAFGGSASEARVAREVPAGQTAWVRVSGRAYLTLGVAPANDQQARASVARGVAYSQTVDWTRFATVERPRFDPPASCAPAGWQPNPGRTLWWRYVAPRAGTINVSAYLYNSTSDVALTAYAVGPDGAVTETACDRSTSGQPNPDFADFAVSEGQTVLFRVSDSNDYPISYAFTLAGLEPVNDDLASAPYLSVGSVVATDTRGAASEPSEIADDCGDAAASLWWYVYARYDGRITVRATTAAGNPAPQISLWRDVAGAGAHPLTRVVCGTTVTGGERGRNNGDPYELYYVRVSSAGGPVTVTVDEASLTDGGEAALADGSGESALTIPEAVAPGLAVTPNPVRGAATLALTLAAPEAHVGVAVFDVLGREVARLHDGPADAGTLRLTLDAAQLPSGAYVVRAVGGALRFTERLTVVR